MEFNKEDYIKITNNDFDDSNDVHDTFDINDCITKTFIKLYRDDGLSTIHKMDRLAYFTLMLIKHMQKLENKNKELELKLNECLAYIKK